jgi:RNA polymerase sigma-70 factor (ECF subfamily)
MAEQQHFADCVAEYLPYLNRFVGTLTRHDPMTEDIVQQTILKALTHADQFHFNSKLKTWLTSIAVNEIYQGYRSVWRRRAIPLITETIDKDRGQRLELPNNSYEAKERALAVRAAVSQLPEMFRSVVELCELQGVSMKEAAQKLGMTLSAVKSRRHRARKKLRPLVANLSGR